MRMASLSSFWLTSLEENIWPIIAYIWMSRNVINKLNPREGALPYMGYIGLCSCEGYGFQAVYSRIGYINQSVWV